MGVSGLVWYDHRGVSELEQTRANKVYSSAKDQIANQTVAVKKLADPFKTDNIAKHMYREVKLLKQLQHENVRLSYTRALNMLLTVYRSST